MNRLASLAVGVTLLGAGVTVRTQPPAAQPPVAAPALAVGHAGDPAAPSQAAIVRQYCVGCHNDRTRAGQLTLAAFDVADPQHSSEVAE